MRAEINQLLDRIREGDGKAFEELLNLKAGNLMQIALSLLKRDKMLAEDAVSQTNNALYKKVISKPFISGEELATADDLNRWLKTVITNNCYNIARANKRLIFVEKKKLEIMMGAGYSTDTSETIFINDVLDELDETERKALWYHTQKYSNEKIAALFGTSLHKTRTLVKKAKKKFREKYGDY